MKHLNKTLDYQTKGEFDFIDITDEVKNFVKGAGIQTGLVNIQIFHTTAALILNENEPLLLEDMKKNLENTASKNAGYKHDDFSIRTVNMCDDEHANGHAHCKAIRLPVNIILNIIDGEAQFGQWQRIFLLELDRSRKRKVQMLLIGE